VKRARAALVAATLGVATFRAAPARAIVLSEDPLEGNSLDVGGAVRSYNFLLRGGPLTSPLAPPGANPASVSILALRPEFELERSSELKLVVHDELTSTASTLPTALIGGALSLGQGRQAPLFLPLQWNAVNHDTYQLDDRIDWLYARYRFGDVSVTLGRQPITIGRGQIWTPEDLLAPFSPLALNTEFKPGVDAARVDWSASQAVTLSLFGVAGKMNPQHDLQIGSDGSAIMSRVQVALTPMQLGVMGGYLRGDAMLGLDFFVDLGHGTDLHGAGTATFVPDAARRPYGRAAFDRAVLGTTTELGSRLHLTAEAYFNGAGAAYARDYLSELSSPRFEVGEVYNVGRAYAGVAADWEIDPLLHCVATVLGNLTDPSAIVAPELRYNLAQNALLVAGAFVPVGKRLSDTGGSVEAQSEFGLYPDLFHVDAKLYF
jgi:hypothetical protein